MTESNPGPLVFEATALSTVPQPLPLVPICLFKRSILFASMTTDEMVSSNFTLQAARCKLMLFLVQLRHTDCNLSFTSHRAMQYKQISDCR